MLDDEGLYSGTAGALVDGGPDYDEALGFLRRHQPPGAKNFVAVEPPVIAVTSRGGGDRGRIRAAARLGYRHRTPLRFAAAKRREEALLLRRGAGRHHRRAAQPGIGDREEKPRVAP